MSEKRVIIEQTIETITSSRQWPQIEATPYQYMARLMFSCGFAVGAITTYLQGTLDYVTIILIGLVVGGAASGPIAAVYIFFVSSRIYQQDRVLRTERFAPEPLPDIEPARIATDKHTAVIQQPRAGALAAWTKAVLTQSRMYFSERQALERGFDYQNVIGEFKLAGIVHGKADNNGVHQLTDYGRKVLEDWLK